MAVKRQKVAPRDVREGVGLQRAGHRLVDMLDRKSLRPGDRLGDADVRIVGPRPERQYFVDQLRDAIPYYFERHRVKPGISGWAQLNYPYGASVEDAKQKFQFDLYYIKNYSLFLDLIVLIQTARIVLWPNGAR